MNAEGRPRPVRPLPVSWGVAALDGLRGCSGWSILCLPVVFVGLLVVVAFDEVRGTLGGVRVLETDAGNAAPWFPLGSGAAVSAGALVTYASTWVLTGWVRLATAWRSADDGRPAAVDRFDVSLPGGMRLRNLLIAIAIALIGLGALGLLAVVAELASDGGLPAAVLGIGAGCLLLAVIVHVVLVRWEVSILESLRHRWPSGPNPTPVEPTLSAPNAADADPLRGDRSSSASQSSESGPGHRQDQVEGSDHLRSAAIVVGAGTAAALVGADVLDGAAPRIADALFLLFVALFLLSVILWCLWGARRWARHTLSVGSARQFTSVEHYRRGDPAMLPAGLCALVGAVVAAASTAWYRLASVGNPVVPDAPVMAGFAVLTGVFLWFSGVIVRAGGARRTAHHRSQFLESHPGLDPLNGLVLPHEGAEAIRGWMRAGESDL